MMLAGSGSFELTISVVLLLLLAFFGLGPAVQALYPGRGALVEKAAPAAGVIGIVGFLWGIWVAIRTLIGIGMVGTVPLVWLFMMIAALTLAALGFLLGYGLVANQLQGKNEALAARGNEVQQRIRAFQVPLGLVALFLAGFHLALLVGLGAVLRMITSFGPATVPTMP